MYAERKVVSGVEWSLCMLIPRMDVSPVLTATDWPHGWAHSRRFVVSHTCGACQRWLDNKLHKLVTKFVVWLGYIERFNSNSLNDGAPWIRCISRMMVFWNWEFLSPLGGGRCWILRDSLLVSGWRWSGVCVANIEQTCVCVWVWERWHTSDSPYNEGIVYPRAVIGSLDHSIDYSCYLKPLWRRNGWGLIEPQFPLQQPPDNLMFQLSIIWSFLQVVGVILKSCYARRAALINDEIMPTAMTTVLLYHSVLEHMAFARSWHALLDDTQNLLFW